MNRISAHITHLLIFISHDYRDAANEGVPPRLARLSAEAGPMAYRHRSVFIAHAIRRMMCRGRCVCHAARKLDPERISITKRQRSTFSYKDAAMSNRMVADRDQMIGPRPNDSAGNLNMKDQAATIVLTKEAPSPTGPYVQGLAGAGLVFVSGQLPIRPDGTSLQDKGFDAQVRQALANVFAIVRAGGSAPERILKVTAFIVGAEHQPLFNEIYAGAFGDHRPARSLVPVSALNNGSLIEIEAIALK
jgi:2-iminobutanoate/2-iminopropanoate deaminase